MNNGHGDRERRTAVRIPLGSEAFIQPAASQHPPRKARCVDLSVDGMTLHTVYVPRPDEIFEVIVRPHEGPLAGPPIHVRAQVKRCHPVNGSAIYEVGVKIIEVLK